MRRGRRRRTRSSGRRRSIVKLGCISDAAMHLLLKEEEDKSP